MQTDQVDRREAPEWVDEHQFSRTESARVESERLSTVHFIAGLPRSGSTLLAAILRQNPRFSAGVTSPLASLCSALHQKMANTEFSLFFNESRRADMLRALFRTYHSHLPRDSVVFDTNRSWTGRVPLLARLYPKSRVICCVREIGWILDSIEGQCARNALQLSKLFNVQTGATVYTRADSLMDSKTGVVGSAWSTLRQAWFADEAPRLIVIKYESLVRRPEATLHRLYEELGEPPYTHDLEHVNYAEPDYDAQLGMPGLHSVRPVVRYESRTPRIPPDLFTKYAKTEFWSQPELNTRGVLVL